MVSYQHIEIFLIKKNGGTVHFVWDVLWVLVLFLVSKPELEMVLKESLS